MSSPIESIPSLSAPHGTFSKRDSEKSVVALSSLSASYEERQILATFDEFCCYCSYDYCANRNNKSTNLQSSQPVESATPNCSSAEKTIEKAMRNRNDAINELILTEKAYVNDLSLIVNGFIGEIRNSNDIRVPDGLKNDKYRMIFANIEAIYEWHREYVLAMVYWFYSYAVNSILVLRFTKFQLFLGGTTGSYNK